MSYIIRGNSVTKTAVDELIDDTTVYAPTVTFAYQDVGAVRQMLAKLTSSTVVLDKHLYNLPAMNIVVNENDVLVPTTYYVYIKYAEGEGLSGASSTLNPMIDPSVEEYTMVSVIRLTSIAKTLTVYWAKQPNQDGIYGTVHNLKENVMYAPPQWMSGVEITMSAGGKISTTDGWIRFVGNEPREVHSVSEGPLALDDETIVAGLDNITTYADASAITAGKWHKLLVGVLRDKQQYSTPKYLVMRQAKPSVEYASAADAMADAEDVASAGFIPAYNSAVTPIYYIVTQKGDYTAVGFAIEDIRASGIIKGASAAPVVQSHHTLQDLTAYDDHSQYIPASGARPLTGNWDAGSYHVQAEHFISDVAIGTAPYQCTSTTVNTNLNADTVDGKHSTDILLLAGTQAMTGSLNMGGKAITTCDDVGCASVTASGLAKALTFESTQTTGSAPLTIASTTKVTNLNADQLDGKEAADFLLLAGGTMTGAIAMGSKSITGADDIGCATVTASGNAKALTLQSTQTTGTAPLTVASTTVVTNLNADTVDAIHGTDLVKKDGTVAMTGALNMNSKSITAADDVGCATVTASGNAKALTLQSTQTTGTAPLTVASTTVVTNLNADTVDGIEGASLFLKDGSVAMTGALDMNSKAISGAAGVGTTTLTASGLAKALTFESTQATGTAPFVVASTTRVDNLNVEKLDGLTSAAYLMVNGTQAMTGALNMGSKAITAASSVTTTGLAKALTFESTQTTGTAPLVVASTTKVTSLNADQLDGLHDTAFLKADGTVTLTGNMAVDTGITIDGVDIGAHAANANAHHNAVTLSTDADTFLGLSTQQITLDTQTANTVLAGPSSGAAAVPAFRALTHKDVPSGEGVLTLTDGQNNNVTLTDGVDVYTITGPTNAFGIAGLTGGYPGRIVSIANISVAKNMTAYHQNASSTATNRIICPGTLGDTSTANYGCMTFTYMGTTQRWLLTSIIT